MSTAEPGDRTPRGDEGKFLLTLWDSGEPGRRQLLTVFRMTEPLAAATAAAWLAGRLMERNVCDWSDLVEFLNRAH